MEKYITIKKLAEFHNINETLLQEFAQDGIIEIHLVKQEPCVLSDQLEKYERIIRLYRDLGVNKAGIEIIMEMREKLEYLQNEVQNLRRELKKYDDRLHQSFMEDFYDVDF
jgi:MerR family transcriptional regulator/heat shock protein HspR